MTLHHHGILITQQIDAKRAHAAVKRSNAALCGWWQVRSMSAQASPAVARTTPVQDCCNKLNCAALH
jgi:hypothetical protein